MQKFAIDQKAMDSKFGDTQPGLTARLYTPGYVNLSVDEQRRVYNAICCRLLRHQRGYIENIRTGIAYPKMRRRMTGSYTFTRYTIEFF